MTELLGLIIISFFITSFSLVPFIDLLFLLKRRRKKTNTQPLNSQTPIHNQLLAGKDLNTPVGGGIIIIVITVILSSLIVFFGQHRLNVTLLILLMTMVLFGFIGLLDDLKKIFMSFSGKYLGIKGRYLFALQVFFSLLIAAVLYFVLGFNNVFIPGIGNVILGVFYIPLASFAIISFSNAYNISDGMDGLAAGLLLICLFAFLALSRSVLNQNLAIFIGIWIGSLIAYLYFNVFPARVYLGDAGAFGFGATLAVIGLLTGKILALAVIGGVYVVIISSSLIQIASKKFFHKKALPVSPIHMYLKFIGWPEPKIVMRFWLAGAIFAIFGLWLALVSR